MIIQVQRLVVWTVSSWSYTNGVSYTLSHAAARPNKPSSPQSEIVAFLRRQIKKSSRFGKRMSRASELLPFSFSIRVYAGRRRTLVAGRSAESPGDLIFCGVLFFGPWGRCLQAVFSIRCAIFRTAPTVRLTRRAFRSSGNHPSVPYQFVSYRVLIFKRIQMRVLKCTYVLYA